jgi:hypothetical protein
LQLCALIGSETPTQAFQPCESVLAYSAVFLEEWNPQLEARFYDRQLVNHVPLRRFGLGPRNAFPSHLKSRPPAPEGETDPLHEPIERK